MSVQVTIPALLIKSLQAYDVNIPPPQDSLTLQQFLDLIKTSDIKLASLDIIPVMPQKTTPENK